MMMFERKRKGRVFMYSDEAREGLEKVRTHRLSACDIKEGATYLD